MSLKTPLYDCHVGLNAKIVDFAGYQLPVQYMGIIEEHMAVRTRAGIFDVSHMGEIFLYGPDALANLNHLLTNDYTNLQNGRVRYSPMCNESGGVVDDLVVYQLAADRFLLVVNAANHQKDVDWIKGHLQGDVKMEDQSDSYAQLALQGPRARDILAKVTKAENIPNQYYSFKDQVIVAGKTCMLSQTGYTGEHGYEIYMDPQDAPHIWQELLAAGKEEGMVPCGLGARDTLRLEASMPLYGHEMTDQITPLEACLNFAVKMQKEDFIGKQALVEKGEPVLTRVGLKVTGRGIVREQCSIYQGEDKVGETTSGTHCPYLQGAYAMALLDREYSQNGTELEAKVRGRRIPVQVVPLPFYRRGK